MLKWPVFKYLCNSVLPTLYPCAPFVHFRYFDRTVVILVVFPGCLWVTWLWQTFYWINQRRCYKLNVAEMLFVTQEDSTSFMRHFTYYRPSYLQKFKNVSGTAPFTLHSSLLVLSADEAILPPQLPVTKTQDVVSNTSTSLQAWSSVNKWWWHEASRLWINIACCRPMLSWHQTHNCEQAFCRNV